MYQEEMIISKYNRLTELLIRSNITVTTMESATSGMIASLITDMEGASAIFKGALVTYSNEYKIKHGVPAEIIDKYSVYSKETAEAMALVCKENFKADIGIGVTGTFGNADPDTPESSKMGEVFLAVNIKGRVVSHCIHLEVMDSRHKYKLAVADKLYEILIAELEKNH